MRSDSADVKPAVKFLACFARNNIDTANFGEARAAVAPGRKLLQCVLASLRHQLHLAIAKIPNPSIESQAARFAAGAVPVANPLNPPADQQPDAMDHG
jgi:hypothetical protein